MYCHSRLTFSSSRLFLYRAEKKWGRGCPTPSRGPLACHHRVLQTPFRPRRATSLLGVTLSSSDIGRTLSAIVVGNLEGRKRKRSFTFVYVGKAGSLVWRTQSPGSYLLCAIRTAFGTTSHNVLFCSSLRYITRLRPAGLSFCFVIRSWFESQPGN